MVAMIMLALPVQEFTIPAYTTTFIIGNSTQDFMTGALIRHFICGDFIEGFLAIGFTEDSGTTVFIPGSTPGFVRDSIQDFTASVPNHRKRVVTKRTEKSFTIRI